MNFVDAVLKEIRERKTQLADGLANNAARDYEEYRFICGEIRGLTAVEVYIVDLAKHLEHSDD